MASLGGTVVLLLFFSATAVSAEVPEELRDLFGLSVSAEREDLYERVAAPERRFLYYISLRRRYADLHFCAATLISPNYAVTSASCMDPGSRGPTVEGSTANLGAYDLEAEMKMKGKKRQNNEDKPLPCHDRGKFEIEEVHVPDGFNNGTRGRPDYDARYDLAVIKLKNAQSLNRARLPLEVPTDCCENVDFVNVGLGRTDAGSGYSPSLEFAAFPFMSYDACAEAFTELQTKYLGEGRRNMTRDLSICVSGAARYCQLDMGSALVRFRGEDERPTLIAVANEATEECSYGRPYVFTNISAHIEWILGIKGVLEDISTGDSTELCSSDEAAPKLSRAVSARPGRYPWAVSIRPHNAHHRCNGALIGPRHVLTTGDCVSPLDFQPEELQVYVGGTHIDPDAEELETAEVIRVKAVHHHRNWRASSRDVNLAIVELRTKSRNAHIALPVQSTDLTLPGVREIVSVDRGCCRSEVPLRVAGWGSTSVSAAFSQTLQVGVVSYVSRKNCTERYNLRDLNPAAFCAGELDGSIGAKLCNGDDGTPLFLSGGERDVLIGIGFSSSATAGCNDFEPAEFLKVAHFVKWIREVIRQ